MSFPTTYVKGEIQRLAYSQSDVVALRFDGFVPAEEVPVAEVLYEDLREQAKTLGIPAVGKKPVLFAAVAKARAEQEEAAGKLVADVKPVASELGSGEPAESSLSDDELEKLTAPNGDAS